MKSLLPLVFVSIALAQEGSAKQELPGTLISALDGDLSSVASRVTCDGVNFYTTCSDCSTILGCIGPISDSRDCETIAPGKPYCVNGACSATRSNSGDCSTSSFICTGVGYFPGMTGVVTFTSKFNWILSNRSFQLCYLPLLWKGARTIVHLPVSAEVRVQPGNAYVSTGYEEYGLCNGGLRCRWTVCTVWEQQDVLCVLPVRWDRCCQYLHVQMCWLRQVPGNSLCVCLPERRKLRSSGPEEVLSVLLFKIQIDLQREAMF